MTASSLQGRLLQTGHVGLNVSDLSRSKEFYQGVFGFEVKSESEAEGRRYAFLGDDQRLVLTLWQQSEGRFEKQRPGLHHLSFQLETIEEVKEVERRLRELDVPLIYGGVVPHSEGSQSGGIFFEDPDGIRLEIYSPTGAGSEHSMATQGPAWGFF